MNKNKYSFIIIFVVMLIIIFFLKLERDDRMDVLKEKTVHQHRSQISSVLNQFKKSNKFIFDSVINNEEILLLQEKALETNDILLKDKYRKALYLKLSDFYSHLKSFGIKQLHFHLPNNESFLRFHKPNKYGDNLTDIRHSLVLVNKNLTPIEGFEEGRIFNGYRYVYPLFSQKKHIGSVEISIGFNVINNISIENYKTFQYMVLNKTL